MKVYIIVGNTDVKGQGHDYPLAVFAEMPGQEEIARVIQENREGPPYYPPSCQEYVIDSGDNQNTSFSQGDAIFVALNYPPEYLLELERFRSRQQEDLPAERHGIKINGVFTDIRAAEKATYRDYRPVRFEFDGEGFEKIRDRPRSIFPNP